MPAAGTTSPFRLISLADLSDDQLDRVLDRAREIERHPRSEALAGTTLGLVFLNPSLRTLASMQAGVQQLGGTVFVLTPGKGTWDLETRDGVVMDGDKAEHIREGIPVLSQYCDALGVRRFADRTSLAEDLADDTIRKIADLTTVPFLNLESAVRHPCQALADWKTLDDREVSRRGKLVLTWAYHPKPTPLAVPISSLTMGLRRGMDVVVCRPEGFGMPDEIRAEAEAIATQCGGTYSETTDREAAFEGADAVIAKEWVSPRHYTTDAAEAEKALREQHRDWCVSESWFAPAKPTAPLLHCLPVRRGVALEAALLDSDRSVVIAEAGNRLHVQKALLLEALGR